MPTKHVGPFGVGPGSWCILPRALQRISTCVRERDHLCARQRQRFEVTDTHPTDTNNRRGLRRCSHSVRATSEPGRKFHRARGVGKIGGRSCARPVSEPCNEGLELPIEPGLEPHIDVIDRQTWLEGEAVSAYTGDGPLITDDHPRPEYFLLRRLFGFGTGS